MAERLRLRAEDAADLPPLSALVQDMAVRAHDIGFDRSARRLALVGNRYRWEKGDRTRVRTGLSIDGVLTLQRRRWPHLSAATLDLLALRLEEGALRLDFAGGASIRLTVEDIDVTLEDLTGAWGARATPRHPG